MAVRIQGESWGPQVFGVHGAGQGAMARVEVRTHSRRVPLGGGGSGTFPSVLPGGGLPWLGSGPGLLCLATG